MLIVFRDAIGTNYVETDKLSFSVTNSEAHFSSNKKEYHIPFENIIEINTDPMPCEHSLRVSKLTPNY